MDTTAADVRVTRSSAISPSVQAEPRDSASVAIAREWRARAQCAGAYTGYFFPPPARELPVERAAREAAATALCRECPVVLQCLDLAQELDNPEGVWGGLTERQRRRRPRRAAVAPAPASLGCP